MSRAGEVDIVSSYKATINHHSPEEEYFFGQIEN